MKRIKLFFVVFLIGSVTISSCKKSFDQPSIEVTGYTLKELPKEYTYLDLELLVTNNDEREALIKDAEYTAVIEGFAAQTENEVINKEILVGTPLELTLPLTLKTNDAIQLLKMLDNGESLDYIVYGNFHVDEPVKKLFNLPIDISGTANVEVGIDDFYEQPEVTVTAIDGTYSGLTSFEFEFDVENTVQNMDSRSVIIDEVEYTVTIEGVKSSKHLYSDTYLTNIDIAGNGSVDLTLPVDINLSLADGATLITGLADATADYVIEGTFRVIDVEGETADFLLPLYVTGTCPATLVELK
jgi:LEA14-like dessication related protein